MQLANKFLKDYRKMFRLLKSGETFVAFDTETTGLNCLTDRITEIGAVKFNSDGILDSFHTLINPQTAIPQIVTEITGITDEMIKDCPLFKEILPDFLDFIGNSILIGHNIQFDLRFLKIEMERVEKREIQNPVIDTHQFARWALPENSRYKQTALADQLGINIENAHRAGDDARVCGDLFLHLIKITADRQRI